MENRNSRNDTPWMALGMMGLIIILFGVAFYMGQKTGKKDIPDMEAIFSEYNDKLDVMTEKQEELNGKIENLSEILQEIESKMEKLEEEAPPENVVPNGEAQGG